MNERSAKRLTRRQALALGACGLLAGAAPVAAYVGSGAGWFAGNRREEFSFAVINDLHVMSERCGDWLRKSFRQIRTQRESIDFCLALGDLAHNGAPDQHRVAHEALATLGVPVYTVLGNHDHNHPHGRRTYEDLFPDRVNYHFEHKGWQFVGLDSTDGDRWQDAFPVQPPTMRWLEKALRDLDQQKPMVLFTHFPLGPDEWQRSTNAQVVLDRFRSHNLRSAFSGHSHRLTWREVGRVTFSTNRCCSYQEANHDGVKEKAFFLCRAHADGSVSRRYMAVGPA
jgi:3',5'-cyclic AMP phosphodiesterase CpdA